MLHANVTCSPLVNVSAISAAVTAFVCIVMSKRPLLPVSLPQEKRLREPFLSKITSALPPTFDSVLSDELVLVIFAYLSWRDLCTIQPTNHHWARLAADNEVHHDIQKVL